MAITGLFFLIIVFTLCAVSGGFRNYDTGATQMSLSNMCENPINILAPNEYIRIDIKRVAQTAHALYILIEINNKHLSLTADDLKLVPIACTVYYSSDAHHMKDVGNFERSSGETSEVMFGGQLRATRRRVNNKCKHDACKHNSSLFDN